jgi:hypothetical protein
MIVQKSRGILAWASLNGFIEQNTQAISQPPEEPQSANVDKQPIEAASCILNPRPE